MLAQTMALSAALTGCSGAYDADGEPASAGRLVAAPGRLPSARPVVVDTDLGADDVVALGLLLRRPDVDVRAVTVAATGLVGCPDAGDVVTALAAAVGTPPPPVACGRSEPGPRGRSMPAAWRTAAASGSGLPAPSAQVRHFASAPMVTQPAAGVIGRLARQTPDLTIVALGPLTNLADLASSDPAAFSRLGEIHAMGGVLDGVGEGDVGEWNAAADPASFEAVLAAAASGQPRLTVVPLDAVPPGTPRELTGPVVGAVAAAAQLPAWWDAATAAALVAPDAAVLTSGSFTVSASEPGRLQRKGDGRVRLVQHLGAEGLRAVYASAFAAR
ncbi:nucleoside hydrolase [Angustibacter sp. Root456]|uniref:nucleoside hydrolase n=1 Tax=Angustibacter sp. Root456 TaxID=1736539 RepID=UPI0006F56375|nr:nucleoside hydrolase [Angustibacter sp. Root456]KQX64385.1 hypothetical protein ASD06_09375 [Angustibacter sp. Root456]